MYCGGGVNSTYSLHSLSVKVFSEAPLTTGAELSKIGTYVKSDPLPYSTGYHIPSGADESKFAEISEPMLQFAKSLLSTFSELSSTKETLPVVAFVLS